MKLVKIVENFERNDAPHKLRRVVVLQRDDGVFSIAEEYYSRSEYEGEIIAEGWVRLPPEGYYATIEIAATEARSMRRMSAGRARCS